MRASTRSKAGASPHLFLHAILMRQVCPVLGDCIIASYSDVYATDIWDEGGYMQGDIRLRK